MVESHRHRHAAGVAFTLVDLGQIHASRRRRIVRQVLHHLSIAHICAILPRLSAYVKVLNTQHYPSDDCMSEANLTRYTAAEPARLAAQLVEGDDGWSGRIHTRSGGALTSATPIR